MDQMQEASTYQNDFNFPPNDNSQIPSSEPMPETNYTQESHTKEPVDWSLSFPENFKVDMETHEYFKDFCSTNQINQNQAQAIIDFQVKAEQAMLENSITEGRKVLENQWGPQLHKNALIASQAMANLDRKMNGRLMNTIQSIGGDNNPYVIEAFYEIGKMFSEDKMGAATSMGQSQAMSTREILQNKFQR